MVETAEGVAVLKVCKSDMCESIGNSKLRFVRLGTRIS